MKLSELVKMFYIDHYNAGYKYIFLNIIPSFFGIYFLSVGKVSSFLSYLLCLAVLFLNIYIIKIIYINLSFILKKKVKTIIFSLIIIFLFMIYFIVKGNFWVVIKIYSYVLFFLYVFISINFKTQKINKLMIILILLFPFYKYTSNNFGIGNIDSFPSIINKDLKTDINWNLDKDKLINCNYVYTSENNYFVKAYINIKTIYYNKYFVNSIEQNSKKKYCAIKIINKSFVVSSNKE